ncbi:MAG: CooT family nickel-binding protein [Promethearchaeota archaeon]
MCEFKVINKGNENQIAEDIVILGYSDLNELILKDVLGIATKIDAALIRSVNTLNQTLIIQQDPLIQDFLSILDKKEANLLKKEDIETFQEKLEKLKSNI